MPTKIKVLWSFCCVVIFIGFVVLSFFSRVEEARENATIEFQKDREKKEQARKLFEENQGAIVHPLKEIKELNALGKHQEAVAMAEATALLNPDNAKVFTWWGISLVKDGRHDEAIKKFVRATGLDASNEKAFLYWGLTLAMDGKFDEAVTKYQAVVELNPENSNAYAYWGASLAQLGRDDEAAAKLEKSLELTPVNQNAYGPFIDLLTNKKEYDRAWKLVSRAREANVSLSAETLDRLSQAQPKPIGMP